MIKRVYKDSFNLCKYGEKHMNDIYFDILIGYSSNLYTCSKLLSKKDFKKRSYKIWAFDELFNLFEKEYLRLPSSISNRLFKSPIMIITDFIMQMDYFSSMGDNESKLQFLIARDVGEEILLLFK